MEPEEEVVSQEPQLRYWNPWRRNRGTPFPAAESGPASPVQFMKVSSNPFASESSIYNCIYPNLIESQMPLTQEIANSGLQLSTQIVTDSPVSGFNTITPLDYVQPQSPGYILPTHQEEESQVSIKQEPEEETYDRHLQDPSTDDIVTFNSIDEALDSIDPPSTPDSNCSSNSPTTSTLASGTKMGLTNEKHEEVVKAAKSLFSKRTRTLYHWLFPDTSKNKLKATVSAAWDTLSEGEKHFYISQVLGRFGLQASSLMVNPQLGGMKGLPNDVESKIDKKKKTGVMEDQRAVDSLFDSCEDAGNWASYSEPKPKKTKPEKRKKRQKPLKSEEHCSSDGEQETKVMKKSKKVKQELGLDFEEDPELTRELEKFRLITEAAEEDIWGDIPDPEELFAEMGF